MILEFLKSQSTRQLLTKALLGLVFVIALEWLFFDASYVDYFSRQIRQRGWVKALVYGSLVAASFGVIAFTFTLQGWKKFIGVGFVFFFYWLDLGYRNINDKGFSLNDLQLALHEAGNLLVDAFASYSAYAINGFFVTTGFIVVAAIITSFVYPAARSKAFSAIGYTAGALTLVGVFGVIQKSHNTLGYFPAPLRIPATYIYALGNATYYGDRKPVEITADMNDQPYEKIVWLIDESIGAQYLSINGYDRSTTPKLAELNEHYINLGYASSISNCSGVTNISLMSGLQLDQLPDENFLALKNPSIFQYAKNAGYETHYISNQSGGQKLQNFMTVKDLPPIDNFSQGTGYDRPTGGIPEDTLIGRMKAAMEKEGKQFIFVVKRGVHFHWEKQYPVEETIFSPTLALTDSLVQENREKAINSYLNGIRWTVDEFFAVLLEEVSLEKTFVFYTSDHGQSILEHGNRQTQCDWSDPRESQGTVPLMLFGNPDEIATLFPNGLTPNAHSHFQLFGSTLDLFGYDTDAYGPTIFEQPAKEQLFYAGEIFGRGIWGKYPILQYQGSDLIGLDSSRTD